MLTTSKQNLKTLAALIWFMGGVVLMLKGWRLLIDAYRLNSNAIWPGLVVILGLIVGGLKARFVFGRFCQTNLNRIEALARPAIWQCYRPRFYAFLLLMVLTGSLLSYMAQDNFAWLIGVSLIDFSLAFALIGSGHTFWTHPTIQP
jgi:hypothetical protein